MATSLDAPVWLDRNSNEVDPMFRFEMMIPDMIDEPTCPITGEILIAIYRVKAQGGNDFIGQISFDLQNIGINGLRGNARNDNINLRLVSSSYPILDRNQNIAGSTATADISLSLYWRNKITTRKNNPKKEINSRSKKPLESITSNTVKISKTPISRIVNKTPQVVTKNAVGSAKDARRKEAQRRLEWENIKMRERLNKHTTQAKREANAKEEEGFLFFLIFSLFLSLIRILSFFHSCKSSCSRD